MALNNSAPLAQSETKTLFLQRLALNMDRANDKEIYNQMKAEVLVEREIMHNDRNNLLPHVRDNLAAFPPYSYSQMTETALHRAIDRIYQNASPATKHYYDLGRYTTIVEENWVIRWLLWHVFRYRDQRRLKHGRPSPNSIPRPAIATASIRLDPQTGLNYRAESSSDDQAGGRPHSTQTQQVRPPTMVISQTVQDPSSTSTRPFDPIRDI